MESSSFWNPESTMLESGIHYPESGIHYPESGIQDCPGFPHMGRQLTQTCPALEIKTATILELVSRVEVQKSRSS